MHRHLQHWRNWYTSLAAEGRLARSIGRWDNDGRVLRGNKTVTTGSYTDGKESMRGMIIIKAVDYDHAVAIAHQAPVLELGGTVEVRMSV